MAFHKTKCKTETVWLLITKAKYKLPCLSIYMHVISVSIPLHSCPQGLDSSNPHLQQVSVALDYYLSFLIHCENEQYIIIKGKGRNNQLNSFDIWKIF